MLGCFKEYVSEVVNGREIYVLICVESEWLVRVDNFLGKNMIFYSVFWICIVIN